MGLGGRFRFRDWSRRALPVRRGQKGERRGGEDYFEAVRKGEAEGRAFASELGDRHVPVEELAVAEPTRIVRSWAQYAHAGIQSSLNDDLAERAESSVDPVARLLKSLDRLRAVGTTAIDRRFAAAEAGMRAGNDQPPLSLAAWLGLMVLVGVLEAPGLFHLLSLSGIPLPGLWTVLVAPFLVLLTKMLFEVSLKNLRSGKREDQLLGWVVLSTGTLTVGFVLLGLGYERVVYAVGLQEAHGVRPVGSGFNFGDYASIAMPTILALVGGLLLAAYYSNPAGKQRDAAARRAFALTIVASILAANLARRLEAYLPERITVSGLVADATLGDEAIAAMEIGTVTAHAKGVLVTEADEQALNSAVPEYDHEGELRTAVGHAAAHSGLLHPSLHDLAGPDVERRLCSPMRTLEELFAITAHVPGEPLRAAAEFIEQVATEAHSQHEDPEERARHVQAVRSRVDLNVLWADAAVAALGEPLRVDRLVYGSSALSCGCAPSLPARRTHEPEETSVDGRDGDPS